MLTTQPIATFLMFFYLFLDTRDSIQYQNLTRHMEGRLWDVYGGNSYQSEPEMIIEGDEESTLAISDSESEFEDVHYPRTVHTCDEMEVKGCASGDDDVIDMFEAEGDTGAEEDSDEEVSHPRALSRMLLIATETSR